MFRFCEERFISAALETQGTSSRSCSETGSRPNVDENVAQALGLRTFFTPTSNRSAKIGRAVSPSRTNLPSGRRAVIGLAVLACCGWLGWYAFVRPSDAQLLQQAIRLISSGQEQPAVPLLDEFLRRNPSHSLALLYRGQLARAAGDRGSAARFWSRVPDKPADLGARARHLAGELSLETGRARDAERDLVESLRLDPASLTPHELLLKLYAVQLRASEMRRELDAIRIRRTWRLDELYKLVNATGEAVNRAQAIPQLEQFIAADPDDLHSLIALGRYYFWDDRPGEAATTIRRVLTHNRDHESALACLAESLLAGSDQAAARGVLQRIQPGPASGACVWKSLGLLGAAAFQWPEAAACLRQSLELQPDDRGLHLQLAGALERAGQTDEAGPAYDRAQQMLHLKTALHRIVQAPANRPEVAVAAATEAGELLADLGRTTAAAAFFEQALAWNPASRDAREGRDAVLRQLQVKSAPTSDTDQVLAQALAAAAQILGVGSGTPPTAHRDHAAASIRFVDRQSDAGLEFQFFNGATGLKYLLETTGGGVAVFDYDADGWPDLFFPQGAAIPFQPDDTTHADRLYRNLGNGAFADLSRSTGFSDTQFSQGAAAGDFNNDGFPDLALANCGTNRLYLNNGDGTFTDLAPDCGIRGEHWSTSLGWGDLNRDGYLDLYVVNYVVGHLRPCRNGAGRDVLCHPQIFVAAPDLLYLNRGDGTFADVTREAGLIAPDGRGLGVVIADFDDDGWPDIYVANDGNPCFLFHNLRPDSQGIPHFAEIGFPSGTALNSKGNATAAMGIACADLDGDGRLDLYVSNFHDEADLLFLNRGGVLFDEVTRAAGLESVTRPMLGWGAQPIDADLDGRPEIFLTNGHLDDRRHEGIAWKMPPQLFANLGGGQFADVSQTSGDFFRGEYLGRGAARLDWNRDGRPDLIVVHQDRPVALLTNSTDKAGHFVIIELHGVQSNRDAIGARLQVTADGRRQIIEVCGGDGYCATNERRQFIGLGHATLITELVVTWPGGSSQTWTDLPADVALTLIEGRPKVVQPVAHE